MSTPSNDATVAPDVLVTHVLLFTNILQENRPEKGSLLQE